MKKNLFAILLLFLSAHAFSQKDWAEKLRSSAMKGLQTTTDDKTRLELNVSMFYSYIWSYPDSALPYAHEVILLAQKLKSDKDLVQAYVNMTLFSIITGDYPQALKYSLQALKVAEQTKNLYNIAYAYAMLSYAYLNQGDYPRAIFYAEKSKTIYTERLSFSVNSTRRSDSVVNFWNTISVLAQAFEKNNQPDSALKYARLLQKAEPVLGESWAWLPFLFGNIYERKGEYVKAISSYKRGLDTAIQNDSKKDIMDICFGLAKTFQKTGQLDSGIFYANKVLEINKSTRYLIIKANSLELLAEIYKTLNKIDSSAKYFELTLATKDSLFNQDKILQIQNINLNEQMRQRALEEERQALKKKIITYCLLAGLAVSFIIILILNRNQRQKQKAKIKIEKAYAELKSTQAQLIHSEKMASLGELTAGIAHEIQNPLNFVNNFSEINNELIEEMNNESDITEIKAISNDIMENEQKINHHGKRADAIVKGMLQHSRKSEGVKEPKDINALCDEYFRLSYHGMRAKDKEFNAEMKTDFDESIGKINIVPQDIGRVLLNVFNNAFYAVNERQKIIKENYQPTVFLSSKKAGDKVILTVKDNGNGIPKNIVDKIFQPFFTTKPTGQGTGLGLSLSYDIIKAHGGEIRVESKEGEGTEFIIQLPAVSS